MKEYKLGEEGFNRIIREELLRATDYEIAREIPQIAKKVLGKEIKLKNEPTHKDVDYLKSVLIEILSKGYRVIPKMNENGFKIELYDVKTGKKVDYKETE